MASSRRAHTRTVDGKQVPVREAPLAGGVPAQPSGAVGQVDMVAYIGGPRSGTIDERDGQAREALDVLQPLRHVDVSLIRKDTKVDLGLTHDRIAESRAALAKIRGRIHETPATDGFELHGAATTGNYPNSPIPSVRRRVREATEWWHFAQSEKVSPAGKAAVYDHVNDLLSKAQHNLAQEADRRS